MNISTVSGIFRVRKEANAARSVSVEIAREGEPRLMVKGSLLAYLVRVIRSHSTLNWRKYLTPPDLDIITGSVITSAWYPVGPFRRMGEAVFRELAGSDLETVRKFGRAGVEGLLIVYPMLVVPGNPARSLKKLADLKDLFFIADFDFKNFRTAANTIQYTMTRPREIPEEHLFLAFCYQIAGAAEGIVLHSGGQRARSEIESAGRRYKITVSWIG